MSQQINLLNPALIKQKDLLNTNNIAIVLGLFLVLMLAYYSYSQQQLASVVIERNQAAEALSAMQAELQKAVLIHTPRAINNALLDQIKQLEHKESMQLEILQTVGQSSATPDKGYAALMHAFAKQSLDGLWLTGFNIDSHTEKLNISGRTLQADLVPEYISRLGNEPALKGKLFAALNIHAAKTEALVVATPAATRQAEVAQQALAPTVKTNPTDKNSSLALLVSPATRSNVASFNTTQYLEFTLQSTDDKSALITEKNKSGDKP